MPVRRRHSLGWGWLAGRTAASFPPVLPRFGGMLPEIAQVSLGARGRLTFRGVVSARRLLYVTILRLSGSVTMRVGSLVFPTRLP